MRLVLRSLTAGLCLAACGAAVSYFPAASAEEPAAKAAAKPDADGWISLFDGKTLDGWHLNPEKIGHGTGGDWQVEDGTITGGQNPPGSGNGGIILTNEKYHDFEVSVDLKPDWGICSGFFLRSNDRGQCVQVMVDYHDAGNVGHIYGEGTGAFTNRPYNIFGVYDDQKKLIGLKATPDAGAEKLPKAYSIAAEEFVKTWKVNDWNTLRVKVTGDPIQITSYINDVKISEFDGNTFDGDKYKPAEVSKVVGGKGSIALQVHGGTYAWPEGAKCRWKNLKIKPL